MLLFKRIDLYLGGADCDISSIAKALSINTVGSPFGGRICEGVIYRLKKRPPTPIKYPYLTVSENIDEVADVLMIRDLGKVKERLKKRVKQGTGLEMLVKPARTMDAASVGKWFNSLNELYLFSHSSRCQFILSSGAGSAYEMVSGRCLDAILKTVGIEPRRHWHDMGEWLEARLSKRVSHA